MRFFQIAVMGVFCVACLAAPHAKADLSLYDATISGETSKLTTPVVLNNTQSAFDFGALSGDVTMEFILEGDPVASGGAGRLATGNSDGSNSLRYEQWNNTGEVGFTRSGVADYTFTPAVPSPTTQTLLAYVWDDSADTMDLYVNGTQAGSVGGVSGAFQMPTGPGFLGRNGNGMFGTIYRVTTYDSILDDETLLRNGQAFLGTLAVPEPTSVAIWVMMGLGLAGFGFRRWRRKQ